MNLAPIDGLTRLDDASCAELRARLTAAGYDGECLGKVEGIASGMLQAAREPLVRSHLTRHPGASSTLMALFGYSFPVPAAAAHAAVGESLAAALVNAGVLAREGDSLRSLFLLMPLDAQWFLSDPLEGGPDAVMGPGMTTLLLHRWLTAFASERMLDLGCGAGSLAIAAAALGARAVATDITERSLAIAAFNARLNGVALETRLGDIASGVQADRFDLVLAQPPYVACPDADSATTYLHGGRFGDELALEFVAESARVLAPGGTALLLFDSPVRASDPLAARLRAAIGDAPVAQLALVMPGASPDQQAIFTAASHHPDLGAEFARSAAAYREHYEGLGVTQVSRVIVALRRPPEEGASALYRITLQLPDPTPPRPSQLAALLDALDLAALPDAALLRERVQPAEGATFAGEWDNPAADAPVRLKVTFPAGSFTSARELGERGWLMFGLLDGSRTIADSVPIYAEECGTPPEQAQTEVLGFVREGLARGLLREAVR